MLYAGSMRQEVGVVANTHQSIILANMRGRCGVTHRGPSDGINGRSGRRRIEHAIGFPASTNDRNETGNSLARGALDSS